MAEAWMVRSGQQERTIDRLALSLRDSVGSEVEEEKRVKELLMAILNGELHMVAREIDHELRNFSRAPEEYEALKWRLFKRLLRVLTHKAELELQTFESRYPWVIFRAASAMADVKLSE